MAQKSEKRNNILSASVALLALAPFQLTLSECVPFEPSSINGFAEIRTIETSDAGDSTAEYLSDLSLVASFEAEKEIILLMKSISADECVDTASEEKVKAYLSNAENMLALIEYIELSKAEDLFSLLAKSYTNLVPNRPEQVVYKLIDGCFKSKDLSINSLGIDLLSLHISYQKCKSFIDKDFSHPYLKRKMNSLKEVLL